MKDFQYIIFLNVNNMNSTNFYLLTPFQVFYIKLDAIEEMFEKSMNVQQVYQNDVLLRKFVNKLQDI